MKLGIVTIAIGGWCIVEAIINHVPILCAGGILFIVLGVVRIRRLRGKTKEEVEDKEQ